MMLSRFLHHLFLPHESNNHRSKVLHLDALFAYTLLLLVFNLGVRFLHVKIPDILSYATDIRVEKLIEATNRQRLAAGLSPLNFNPLLSAAAAEKARDMFAGSYWAHNSPSGKSPWDFIIAAGYRYVLAGENLAKNFQTSEAVVEAWMASSTHRDNILKSGYQDIGFAVVNGVLGGEETTLVVQMFGATSGEGAIPKAVAAQPTAPPLPSPTLPPKSLTGPVQPAESLGGDYLAVSKNPRINIPSLTREVGFVFGGILIGVLAVDAWIVARRRVVRMVGHNLAHILFLAAILLMGTSISRGSLL